MNKMAETILKMRMKFQDTKFGDLVQGEAGQDLVEYALLVSLIALAAISGVKHIATAVNIVFGNVSSSLG
jgi:pilus assembly protein Flp/PilA